ncbi:S1 family peptidase [Mycolicibacterium conceptionense]|uniref:S1 family peptidase n=1 Tax=Mycolicibacterium conceptionense TaxID=451644 RepID=UPI001F303E26|nr:S1 family peptidase [Mycolicibacterium conceptionense]
MKSASTTRRTSPRRLAVAVAAAAALIPALLATPTAAAASEPPNVTGPWVSLAPVEGTGVTHDFTAAPAPRPGVSIMQQVSTDQVSLCTASWPVISTGSHVGYLTAGHCDLIKGAPVWMYTNDQGTKKLTLSPLQNSERGVDTDGQGHDSSLFFLSQSQQDKAYGTEIADGVKLRGVMSVSDARKLRAGTPVCMNGSRSGLTCGPLIAADSDDFEWGGKAVSGDSGAPVFVVNGKGDALAIGMLQRGPTDTDNFATYLSPVLSRLGLRLIVDGEEES